jgi:hypothetical protein
MVTSKKDIGMIFNKIITSSVKDEQNKPEREEYIEVEPMQQDNV